MLRNILLAAVAAIALITQPLAASIPASASDEIVMPDDGLRACINGRLGQAVDAPITHEQADKLTQAFCSTGGTLGKSTDLTGIEAFQNLWVFTLTGSELTNLDLLAQLPKLTSLGLSEAGLTDISPLSGLTGLTSLSLDGNQISDLTPLENLVLLDSLGLEGNQVEDISPLSQMTSLEYLFLQGNLVTDLSPLHAFPVLNWLDLTDNRVSDLTPLSNMPALYALWLGSNNISHATLSETLVGLRMLSLNDNQIESVESLQKLPGLDFLHLNGNQISDASPLAGLNNMRRLDLSENHISDLSPLQHLVGSSLIVLHAMDQTILLPDVTIGDRQTFTLTNVYGEAVVPESETATVMPEDGSWVLPAPGEHILSWSSGQWGEIELPYPDTEVAGRELVSDIFSGIITQTASEAPVSSGLTVESPVDVTVQEGANAVFTSAATSHVGNNTPRWQQSSDNGATWTEVPGPWTDTLRLENVSKSMTGNLYRVEYSNDADGAVVLSDPAKLTVTSGIAPPVDPPHTGSPGLTPPGDPGKDLPSTGANRSPQLWATTGAILLIGMMLIGLSLHRKRLTGQDE